MEDELYDPQEDASRYELSDTRKKQLTLRHLHKLRIARDIERKQNVEKLVFLNYMYGSNEENPSM